MSVTSIELPVDYETGLFQPPFDRTGSASENRVANELQTFTANAEGVLQLFIPSFAPFFAQLLEVRYVNAQNTEVLLSPGVDFSYAFPFIGASRSIGLGVFGGIIIHNESLAGKLKLGYQAVGGTWQLGMLASQEVGNFPNVNPYWASWEQVARYGTEFPIVNNDWDKPDATSVANLVTGVVDFGSGFFDQLTADNAENQAALNHVLSTGNPHNDTRDTIGLSNVANYSAATDAQAAETNNSLTYISAGQLGIAFRAAVPPASGGSYGMVKMNIGTQPGDGIDASKALTAEGFVRLVKDRTTPISDVFNKAQIEVPIPNWPLTFPLIWQGGIYGSMEAFITAVGSTIGVYPIEYSMQQGLLWLPAGTAIPNLVTSVYGS